MAPDHKVEFARSLRLLVAAVTFRAFGSFVVRLMVAGTSGIAAVIFPLC